MPTINQLVRKSRKEQVRKANLQSWKVVPNGGASVYRSGQ